MSQKQSTSACTHILVVFILKWEKKTSSHLEITSFIHIYNNPPPKDEMRWKRNLTFNNDDGKKTVQKTIYIKK